MRGIVGKDLDAATRYAAQRAWGARRGVSYYVENEDSGVVVAEYPGLEREGPQPFPYTET